jgi:zinc protease
MIRVAENQRPQSVPGPQDVVRHELPNGIVVLVRENHVVPTVSVVGALQVGSINTQPSKEGLAGFTAAALMRGAGQRTFAQVFEALESVGASLAFRAGSHATTFSGQCLVEDLDLLLDLLRDALYTPAFPADQIRKLRGEIITGLQIQAHDTRHVSMNDFLKLAYPAEHLYSRNPAGSVDTVSAITRRDIVNFHHRYYGPRRMIIVVVGDVRAGEVLKKLEATLGRWSAAPGAPDSQLSLPPLQPLTAAHEKHAFVPGKSQSGLVLGAPGPCRSDPDYRAARLANTILGVFGLMGRLGSEVRDRQGLAYYAYSVLRVAPGPAPWFVTAGVSPDNVSRAVASIRDQVRRMQDDIVPAEELADNQSFLVGSLPLDLETNDGVSSLLLTMEMYNLGLDYLQRYPDMMREITAEQIQAAVRKYLDADRYALAVAGPEAAA